MLGLTGLYNNVPLTRCLLGIAVRLLVMTPDASCGFSGSIM